MNLRNFMLFLCKKEVLIYCPFSFNVRCCVCTKKLPWIQIRIQCLVPPADCIWKRNFFAFFLLLRSFNTDLYIYVSKLCVFFLSPFPPDSPQTWNNAITFLLFRNRCWNRSHGYINHSMNHRVLIIPRSVHLFFLSRIPQTYRDILN